MRAGAGKASGAADDAEATMTGIEATRLARPLPPTPVPRSADVPVALTIAELNRLKRQSMTASESEGVAVHAEAATPATPAAAAATAAAAAAAAPDASLKAEAILHHRLLGHVGVIHDSTRVPLLLAPGTTAGAVLRELVGQYPGFDALLPLAQYGLVVAPWHVFARTAFDDLRFLGPVDDLHAALVQASDCEGGGEAAAVVHVLLRPWSVLVSCAELPSLDRQRLLMPALLCRELVAQLLAGSELRAEQYALVFRVAEDSVELWLRGDSALRDYPQVATLASVGALCVVRQPVTVRVAIAGQVQTVEVGPTERCADIVQRIGALCGVANASASYGLFLLFFGWHNTGEPAPTDRQAVLAWGGEGLWLAPDVPVYQHYRGALDKGDAMLSFRVRPCELTISYRERRLALALSYSAPLADLMGDVCDAFGIASRDELFLLESDRSTARPLEPSESLKQRGVQPGAHLILKRRGEGALVLTRSAYTNIWEEGDGSLSRDPATGVLMGATLNRLVEQLTNIERVDVDFMDMFLLQYASFCPAATLFAKLCERYDVPRNASLTEKEFVFTIQKPLQLVVLNVLREWLMRHVDLEDVTALMPALKSFVERVQADGHTSQASRLAETLQRLAAAADSSRQANAFSADSVVESNRAPTRSALDRELLRTSLTNMLDLAASDGEAAQLKLDEASLARQITLRDHPVYAAIEPRELLHQAWTRPKLYARCPHVLGFIERFNRLANWVSISVLREETVRERVRVLGSLIKLGECFSDVGNFNGVMAVIVGLNNAAVSRLKWTKLRLPRRFSKMLAALEATMSMSSSFKTYRAALTAMRETQQPALPYIGVFLTDLVFLEDGNPDTIQPDGVPLLNVDKRRAVYTNIKHVLHWRTAQFAFTVDAAAQAWLDSQMQSIVDENELFRLSLLREPRGADRDAIL